MSRGATLTTAQARESLARLEGTTGPLLAADVRVLADALDAWEDAELACALTVEILLEEQAEARAR